MKNNLDILLELSKARIAVLAVASALTGYALAAHGIGWDAVLPLLGVFLLACGAGALNQVQEYRLDAVMRRTRNRPIPAGRISRGRALLVSAMLLLAGAVFLAENNAALTLGILTVVWYNAIYTNLKRMSPFAAIPGGVVGSLPPIIGWVVGGGSPGDPLILAVAAFFFVWQVPHFWLLLMRIGEDYERAGLPTLTSVFSREQMARVTYVWMLATGVACLLIPLFMLAPAAWLQFGFVAASVWLGWHATVMLRSRGDVLAFHQINIYALIVMVMLSVSGFIG